MAALKKPKPIVQGKPYTPPPKKTTGKSFTQYWQDFIKANKGAHPNLANRTVQIAIQQYAKETKLDPILLAAYLLTTKGGIGTNPNRIKALATQYSAVLGASTGVPPGVAAYIPKGYIPKQYGYGTSAVSSINQKAVKDQLTGAAFKQFASTWNVAFQYYLGRNASASELKFLYSKQAAGKGWGKFQTLNWIVAKPGFYKSATTCSNGRRCTAPIRHSSRRRS